MSMRQKETSSCVVIDPTNASKQLISKARILSKASSASKKPFGLHISPIYH